MFDPSTGGGAHTNQTVVDPGRTAASPDLESHTRGPGSLPEHSAELTNVVDGLLALDLDTVTDDELAAAMIGLRQQRSRLDAALSRLTAVFDARGVWGEDGSRSAIDWIAARGRLPRPQVAGEVRDARRVRSMPVTCKAWEAGEVHSAHVRTLALLAGHPRAGSQFEAGEELLVDQAREQRFEDWARLCAYWCDAADPDGPEQRQDRDAELRNFRIPTTLHGVGHPDGYLAPLAAATVNGALDAIEGEMFAGDWAAAKEIHGEAVTAAHLSRTSAQRRHDALVEMACRSMTAPADGKRPAPLVTVMVDYPTLAGRVCELAGTGTIVAPGDIVELLARDDTLIDRVVFDGPNRVRDISSARTFRGTLRRILEVIHRRCTHDTCHVPAHRCEGDHIIPVSDGGPTSQDNGRPVCGFHNRWYYRNGQSTRTRGRRDDHPPAD